MQADQRKDDVKDRMSEVNFEEYSQQSVHFFSRKVPRLLSQAVQGAGRGASIVDVGCGDGHMVWALLETGCIEPSAKVVGVDLSELRVQRFERLTGFSGMQAQGDFIPSLDTGGTDLTLSTMVIEHIPDDAGHVRELARITKPGGWLYLSTVIRKPGAWYFRKAPDGRRVLDPTHLREYADVQTVVDMVEAGGFVVKQRLLTRLFFPIAHPFVRLVHARRPVVDVQRIFLTPFGRLLELAALPIPRYRSIELLAQRVDDSVADRSARH